MNIFRGRFRSAPDFHQTKTSADITSHTQNMNVQSNFLGRIPLIIAGLALLTGCMSTGSKVEKAGDLSGIRNIGINVSVRSDMEVLNATEDTAWLGFFLLGFAGDEIEKSIHRAEDAKTAATMEPVMNAQNYQTRVESIVQQALVQSGKFESVNRVGNVAKDHDNDATLVIDVMQWGIRASHADRGKEKSLDIAHEVDYRLVQSSNGQVIWHERQIFPSAKPRALEEYQQNAEMLNKDLEASLNRYCRLIVNRLIY